MAEPNALHLLLLAGSSSAGGGCVWQTGSDLGLYVQLLPTHIRLIALPTPVSYILESGTLPAGLTLSSNGIITGTMPPLTEDTTYTFVVSAYNGTTNSLRIFTMTGTVEPETQPIWQTPAGLLGEGDSGQIFVATLLAIDPSGLPIGYRIANGSSLPPGVNYGTAGSYENDFSGRISTSAEGQTYNFELTASVSNNGLNLQSTQAFIINVPNTL